MSDNLMESPGDVGAMQQRLKKLEGENKKLEGETARLREALAAARHEWGVCDAILESATDYAIFTIDPEGRVTSWNAGAENLLGWREAEALGMDSRVMFTPEERGRGAAEAEMAKAAAQGRAEDERWHLRQDGTRFLASGLLLPLRSGAAPGFLKILRDASERERTRRELRTSEERLRRAFEIETVGVIFFDLDGRITEANDAFLAMGGYSREDVDAGLLHWDELTPPEWMPASERAVEEFKATGRTTPYEKEYYRKDGSRWWALFAARQIGETEGVEFVLDITERKRAEAALRESEERLRLATEAARMFTWDVDLASGAIVYSGNAADVLGFDPPPNSEAARALVHPNDREETFARYEHAVATGKPLSSEYRFIDPGNGRTVWVRAEGRTMDAGPHGRRRLLGVSKDITERKQAEQALLESEARFRQFGDASSDVLWIRDAATLRFEYLSPAFEAVYGESCERVLGDDDLERWAALILSEDRDKALGNIGRIREGERVTQEFRIVRPSDGQVRWLRDTSFPLLDHAGRVGRIGGIGQDVSAENEAQERQQRLTRELDHRVKNTLAVVQAIASQTVLASCSLDEFAEAFQGRLGALAQAHGLLTTTGWKGADLKALVEETLEPYRDGEAVAADGPPIALLPRRAVALALALHELATNAAKHGALSVPGGRVGVRWEVREEEDGARRVRLVWRETGGPEVGPPARKGFGTGLIEQALRLDLEGTGGLRFEREGLVCELAFPLG